MASGSRGRGQGSAGAGVDDALDTLTNPDLALLPAAELVVRLHRDDRSGADFADVALVLAARERRLAEAEDRVRAADVVAAGLRDTIRALELRTANAEALALARRISLVPDSGGVSGGGGGGERADAREEDCESQAGLERQIGAAAELTGDEIRPARGLTASETQIAVFQLPAGMIEVEDGEITPGGGVPFAAGGVKATAAEVGDNMPRPSPLRTIGATIAAVLPAASSISMPDDAMAGERVVVDVSAGSSHEVVQAGVMDSSRDEVSEALAGKRRKEPAAASVSHDKEEDPLKKKPKPADIGALVVASEDSDTDTNSDSEAEETEEELCFTEEEGRKMLDILKAQVAAWDTVHDAADATQGTLQAAAAPPVEEVQNVIEPEPRESVGALARLQEEISAYTELEVWKHSVTEAQAKIRACEAETKAWKQRASEAETRLQAQDKTIASLQDKLVEGECKLVKAECRIRVSDELAARLQDKIEATEQDRAMEVEAQIRRATKIKEHLRARIRTLELKVASLEAHGSDINRSDRTVATIIDEHDRMAPEIEVHIMVPTAGATNNKGQRQKGVSFYNEVFKAEMEKRRKLNAGNKEDEESLKKQAAAAASKELYLRCWSQAPYVPSQIGSQSAEEDSSGEA